MNRLRSMYFVNANREFKRLADLGVQSFDFSFIQSQFTAWFHRYAKGRYVRLIHKQGEKYLFVRMFCRFLQEYKRKVRSRLAWLNFVHFRTFLSLTVSPKQFMRLSDEYDFINKAWSKLRQRLWKQGRFFYLRVLEITKKGRPHLHILTTKPFLDVRLIRRLWLKYGGGPQMRVSRVRGLNGLSYVLKYITKAIPSVASSSKLEGACEPNVGVASSLLATLLFASNKRLFSFNDIRSRSMLDLHLRASVNEWLHTGSVPLTLLESFAKEKERTLSDFFLFKPDLQDLRDYPSVFGVDCSSV